MSFNRFEFSSTVGHNGSAVRLVGELPPNSSSRAKNKFKGSKISFPRSSPQLILRRVRDSSKCGWNLSEGNPIGRSSGSACLQLRVWYAFVFFTNYKSVISKCKRRAIVSLSLRE